MKAFISSTYKDLIEYRAAANRAVEGTDYQASKMEVFGARSEEPVTTSLDEIDQCEVFIGIYAFRYGFIPDGADSSITEMEYARAKKLGKAIYCFLLDEENQPWLKKWIEDEPGKSKLEQFKQHIQKSHICDYFTTPDDLRAKVANALSHFVANQKPVQYAQIPIYQPPKPTGNTLPPEGFFVGRKKARKTIAEALSPESRTWGVLIDGPGGVGKTALAIKAAHEAPGSLFERKIFISAKVRDLTPEERPDVLRLALAGKKALIVFDNLESLPEEERTRFFQFLSRLPEGNNAIVTSRRRDDVDARIVRLNHLFHDEALLLIADLAKKYPRLERTSQQERDDLYGMTQGNPLLIRWIAGQLGRSGSQCHTIADACNFIEQAPIGNDPLEYIYGDLLKTFTRDETLVLAALTWFTKSAKLQWLAQITGLPERAAETALEDLTDRAILVSDPESKAFYLPPLAGQFIKTRRPEAVTKTGDALANKAYTIVMQFGGWHNNEGFRMLDAEWDFLSAALPILLRGDNDCLQTVCNQLHVFLDFTGRWDEEIWLNGLAEMRALNSNDKEHAGWRAYKAGMIYYFRNQIEQLLECAARVMEHWHDSTPRNKAFAIYLRGIGFKLNKDYPSAIAALNEALKIWRSSSHESDEVAIALNDLASVEHANKDYAAAECNYREALRIAKKVNYKEDIASITGNLADLALDCKQWSEAEAFAREALVLGEEIERQDLIARDCHRIAKALFKQNRKLEEALSFARRAIEILMRLRHIDLHEAQETLAEIEKAMSVECALPDERSAP